MKLIRDARYVIRDQHGFTLIELVIYMGLLSIVVGLFAGILVTIVRIQTQQTSTRQVISELNFVMNTITRDIKDSASLSVATNTLTIGTSVASTNPIIISIENGAITKKEGSQATSTLTTDRVVADELTFDELVSGDNQAVQIVLTFSFNTENPAQDYTQTLQTTVAPLLGAD